MLSIAKLDPKDFGYLYFGRPGFYGSVREEVVYLKQCSPVLTTYRKTKECYQDIPIFYRNESRFLTPRSKLITDHGSLMDCSQLMPPKYFIDGSWYQPDGGALHIAKDSLTCLPQTQPAQIFDDWKFEEDDDLYSKGIYTEEELVSYEKMIRDMRQPTREKCADFSKN
ncbi:hypothetical protein DMENIID0001_037970 [Sergentomyia squamirostris]